MEDLGYSEKDVRRFARQLEERLNATDAADAREAARQRQFDSLLDQIGREADSASRAGRSDGPAASGFNAPRRPAPPEYRDLGRSYRQRLLKKGS